MTACLSIRPFVYHLLIFSYLCSQLWFPTVQEVLQADWHDVWHSPHPPFLTVFCNLFVFNVFTCFILRNLLSSYICQKYIIFSAIKEVFFYIPSSLILTVFHSLAHHSPDHSGSHAHQQRHCHMQSVRSKPPVHEHRSDHQHQKICCSHHDSP